MLWLLRGVVLVLTVCAYVGCPLAISWAKVVGFDGPAPFRGRPFREASVVVVSWALVALTGLLLSASLGGGRAVLRCFDLRAAARIAPAGAGWALADVCEILAIARIDPATYGVISQARLLACAVACRALRGMRQSRAQWGILVSLSLVCAIYCVCPDEAVVATNHERIVQWRMSRAEVKLNWYPSPPPSVVDVGYSESYWSGISFALCKVTLSVLSGVYGECCFKGQRCAPSSAESSPEVYVQVTQASISSLFVACLGYMLICWCQGEGLDGFFSGPDGEWDSRTCLVVVMLCFREWICNLCVKHFDSLVKNICNAIALVGTYTLAVTVSGDATFSFLKVLLLLAAVVEVFNYTMTRRDQGLGTLSPSACLASDVHGTCIPVAEYAHLAASYRDSGA